jgi:hypothetical protein
MNDLVIGGILLVKLQGDDYSYVSVQFCVQGLNGIRYSFATSRGENINVPWFSNYGN